VIQRRGGEHMTRGHDDTDKKFGTAIRLARKRHKLTQMQLGEALGVTFQQIQKYEKGTNLNTSPYLQRPPVTLSPNRAPGFFV
jgi:DNA-binding XRE family transcriptional regulator